MAAVMTGEGGGRGEAEGGQEVSGAEGGGRVRVSMADVDHAPKCNDVVGTLSMRKTVISVGFQWIDESPTVTKSCS